MFDEIRCDYPLPDAAAQNLVFQTKCLDRALDRYTITRDGRLILHEVRYEEAPEEERPYYGKPEWGTPWGRLVGCLKSVPLGDREIPHHGDIVFYDFIDVTRQWYQYCARFTNGRVQWIERDGRHSALSPEAPGQNQPEEKT